MDAIYGLSDRQKATRWVVRLLVVFWAMFFAAPASAQTATVTPGSSTTALDFGSIAQGSSSTAQTLTITNTSTTNVTLRLNSINITGANAGSFILSNGCGSTLARRASCTVRVTFRPQATGPLQALLSIATNATNVPGGLFSRTLTGNGTPPPPVVSVTPTSIAFGSVGLNQTSGPIVVTVRNTGLGTLNFAAISAAISAQTTANEFAVSSNTCSAPVPTNGTCFINVTFRPTTAGAKTGNLRITTTNASPLTYNVSLTGTGTTPTPVLTLSPTRLTLTCATPYGGPVTLPVTASNTGTAPLTLGNISFAGSGASYFSASKVACLGTLTPGAACNIAVTFSPTGKTSRSATMTVTATSTVATVASKSVSLTGSCRSHPSP